MPEDWQAGGFGLYLHWPFCAAKCPYCDFNSHVSRSIDHDAWLVAYLEELDKAAAETQGRVLQTIFFGGGTPSLMKPAVVEKIIARAMALWVPANDIEITLEANPGSVDAGNFADLAHAGVNRVSLGVQALNDADLARLGRLHSAKEAEHAVAVAMAQFDRVSFDLMYGRQDQTLEAWEHELKASLTKGVSHLSLYQLTIEDGTAFGDRYARGALRGLPDDGLSADMYTATQEICHAAGLPAYEVSNHAAPGQEARHNLIYWRYGDYVGIGPGAHGRLTLPNAKVSTEHQRMPTGWLKGPRETRRKPLSASERGQEMLLMGLRLREGFDIGRYERTTGQALSNIDALEREGWITVKDGNMAVQPDGFIVLNAILDRLLDAR